MFIAAPDVQYLVTQIEMLQPTTDEVVLILFAEEDAPEISGLIQALNHRNINFLGGIFPGLIYGNQRKAKGCIVKKFKALAPPFCTLSISEGQFNDVLHIGSNLQETKGTALVLVDGLTPNIYVFLEKLNDLLGEQCNFIGGGAGSISLKQRPCVFCKDGFFEDAAVVCVIDKQVQLGVRHGWEQLAGPLVATQTDGNTIVQLNWQPAINVYNSIVAADFGTELTVENFAGIAQGYPFGILREKEDDIVRDPLAIGENGAIICIGEVPANTVLHVLKGHPQALLEAAKQAVYDCGEITGMPIQAESTFIVDCITRTLFLDEQFAEEMNIVRENLVVATAEQEPFGILSLGEISSYGDGLLELFNKTIVIGTFS